MDITKQNLLQAENIAIQLFEVIEKKGLIVAGKTESELNEEIFSLAKDLFSIQKHWHKRIVRTGENTLFPYDANPPNLTIQEDDILFFDFGPIIEHWEADLGRTYVLGNDPIKHKIKNDVETAWKETKAWFEKHKSLKASELFKFAKNKAQEFGFEFGGEIAGHLIGEFPHEDIASDHVSLYVHPENHNDMFETDALGRKRNWILEMHFVDRERKFGAFYEQLLV
ncbi:MAG: aminopeptidase [Flavobacteriaceae bacterium]|nr:MAG: aminopeptidase [Flavobacteriaceae bacterium]